MAAEVEGGNWRYHTPKRTAPTKGHERTIAGDPFLRLPIAAL